MVPRFKGISRLRVVAHPGLVQVPVVPQSWAKQLQTSRPLQSKMQSVLPFILLLVLCQEYSARPPNILLAWQQPLVLSSTAWAAEAQGSLLGEYVEVGVSRGRPYYRQRDTVGKKDYFLYYGACSGKRWLVGS